MKETIINYSVINRRRVWFKRNDKVRIRAVCQEDCLFVIYGARLHKSATFQIKTLELEHVCAINEKVSWLNSRFLTQRYVNQLFIDPDWFVDLFKAAVQEDYGQEVITQQIYRARQRAEQLNYGT